MNGYRANVRIDSAPLYADESTRPIVHALIAAVGYINGQSVNSAAVMTAALKVGLEALAKVQEQKQAMRDAISIAHRDIGEWIQLAEQQREKTERPDHAPQCPSEAGIQRSHKVREIIGKAGR